MADQILEWKDISGFIRRRRKSFVVIFFMVFIASVVLAFTLPPVYRGETTIIIQDQQIPESYVQSTITAYAEERLATIKQQIFSNERLQEIIREFDLYPDIRNKYGMGDAVTEMRNAILLETESASFLNPKTGKSAAATIACKLYYEGEDPKSVQTITNVLSDLFIQEDNRIKENITSITTGFLTAESEALKSQMQIHEKKITEFKQAHFGELPEHNTVNLSTVARLERELDQVEMQIRNFEEKKIGLQGQLATVDPLTPISIDGTKVARNPSEQLKSLRLKLLSAQASLSDKHPDIIKLKNEIENLEKQEDAPYDYQEQVKRLDDLKVKRAALKGRYGPKHPDVIKMDKEIKEFERDIANRPNRSRTLGVAKEAPDNPVYINLTTQIASINSSLRNLMVDKQDIQVELDKYRQRIINAPLVEQEYNDLTRDYSATKAKYNEIIGKLMTANVAKGMEEEQHGQRFEIKDFSFLPKKPYKPNRIAVMLLGFVLASGLGVGFAGIQEFFDQSIKNENELYKAAEIPVLSVISKVVTRQEKLRSLYRRFAWTVAAIVILLIGMKMVDTHVFPVGQLVDMIINNAKNM